MVAGSTHSPADSGERGEGFVSAGDALMVLNSQRGGRVALRVEVDDEYLEAAQRQGRREVHGRGRLAHATLLVGDDEHARGRRAGKRRFT
jgi:hypothetical protein